MIKQLGWVILLIAGAVSTLVFLVLWVLVSARMLPALVLASACGIAAGRVAILFVGRFDEVAWGVSAICAVIAYIAVILLPAAWYVPEAWGVMVGAYLAGLATFFARSRRSA